jgi:hypothetical protein
LGTVFKAHLHRKNLDVFTTVREFEPPRRVLFEIDWPGEAPMFEGYVLDDKSGVTVVVSEGEWSGSKHLPALNPLWFLLMRPVYALGAFVGLRLMRRQIERRP